MAGTASSHTCFLGVPAGGGDGVWMHQCVERLHVAAVTGGEPPDGDRL